MEAARKSITVETTVNVRVEKAWDSWTKPEHITKWCQASDDWHAPYADNDVRIGGSFKTTMAAKDGSFSFDFGGIYTDVVEHQKLDYAMSDGRKVAIRFTESGDSTHITETFDLEDINPEEMQRGGWQAILESYKKYTESL